MNVIVGEDRDYPDDNSNSINCHLDHRDAGLESL